MNNMDLLRTLSDCRFYQRYLEAQEPAKPLPPKPKNARQLDPQSRRRVANRVFRKYCLVTGGLLLGAIVLVVSPLWLVHPPYGKTLLLTLPCTVLCALSWMTGAWWAWDKDRWLFMAVTLGAVPVRLFLMLGWVLLVASICEIPFLVFVLGLMWHWLFFTVPEFAMLLELTRSEQAARTAMKDRMAEGCATQGEVLR
jgi:hypothetical protein